MTEEAGCLQEKWGADRRSGVLVGELGCPRRTKVHQKSGVHQENWGVDRRSGVHQRTGVL